MRIGLFGESANDLIAIKKLLKPEFPDVQFEDLLGGKTRESVADSVPRSVNLIKSKLKVKHFDFLILVRDLDGFESEKQKVREKEAWFQRLNNGTGKISLFLLNIREIEALVLADIGAFNKYYKTNSKFQGDPTKQNAKQFLINETKKLTKQYHESHVQSLFPMLDYAKLRKIKYFDDFHNKLHTTIKEAQES